jgi:hypothetical protein
MIAEALRNAQYVADLPNPKGRLMKHWFFYVKKTIRLPIFRYSEDEEEVLGSDERTVAEFQEWDSMMDLCDIGIRPSKDSIRSSVQNLLRCWYPNESYEEDLFRPDEEMPGEEPQPRDDFKPEWLGRPRPRQIYPAVDLIARLLIAVASGTFLLAPMIVMNFVKSRNDRLIITSLFVLFFAIAIASTSRASNQELAGASAAYAAVLVVYIGASS